MTSKQNGGYRSPSGKSHNRSRTRSYDSYDDYTDSFESDTEVDLKKSGTSSKTFNKKKPAGTGITTTSNRKPANSRARNIKPTPKGKGQKNGRGSVQVASPRDMDAVSKRMLSARRLKINELRNQVEELNLLVQDLKLENRTMKRDFRRQDKALSRYEVQESELPSLIAQHSEEVRTLRDQIKRSKEKYENSNKRYKDLSEELHKTKKLLKQYKDLAEHKKLGERDELARKLTQTEVEMDEKDKKIRDLERYIDNLQKNQRHELAIEIHRHRETQRRVAHYEDMIQGLETQIKEKQKMIELTYLRSRLKPNQSHLPQPKFLGFPSPLSQRKTVPTSLISTPHQVDTSLDKTPSPNPSTQPIDLDTSNPSLQEKEKILDIKNIYSHRIVRPPHKLPSGASTPLSMKRSKRSSLSDHRLTPREKVKQYEEKRREDDRKQREQTPRTVSAISTQTTPPPPAKTQEELNSRSTTPSPPSVKSESDGEDVSRPSYLQSDNKLHSTSKYDYEDDFEKDSMEENPYTAAKQKGLESNQHFENKYEALENKFSSYHSNAFHADVSESKDLLLQRSGKKSYSNGQGALSSKYNIANIGPGKRNNRGGGSNVHRNTNLSSPRKKKELGISKNKQYGAMKFTSVERPSRYASANVKERERRKGELIKRNQEYSSRNSIAHDEVEEEARDSAEWQYRKDKERWDAEEEEKRRRAAELDEARRKDRQMQEARERERLEEREKLGRERAEEEMRRKREREEEEQREREEREKWEREERERREREDRERVEEERRYRDERERREREERERREEERAREERERMEKDAQFQEERRKKDALLAKLRALDENDSDNQSNLYKQNKPVEKMKSERTNISSSSSKKSYAFTKPIENLHQGKPSHEDNSIPYIEKRRRSGFVDEDVPYQPSFDDSNANNQQAKKKADLMKNLFGDSAVTSTSKKTEPTKRGVDRPEVDDLDGGNEFFMTKSNRQPSKDADLAFTFSSGNNRGRNENGSSDSKLLPRRQSQQPTTITKPTVSLIDDPDDLEEVIL